jgi:hypothetical protein
MSLDLEISNILGRGRASAPLSIGEVREISASDLALFENRQAVPASDPIKKISERHHMVAKMLARGAAPGEVARLTGYEPSRISVLKASPAMQELIALYREDLEAEFTPIIETLVGVSKDALNLIRERMEEEGDKIPLPRSDLHVRNGSRPDRPSASERRQHEHQCQPRRPPRSRPTPRSRSRTGHHRSRNHRGLLRWRRSLAQRTSTIHSPGKPLPRQT